MWDGQRDREERCWQSTASAKALWSPTRVGGQAEDVVGDRSERESRWWGDWIRMLILVLSELGGSAGF